MSEMMLPSITTSSAAMISTPVPGGIPATVEPGAPKLSWLFPTMKLWRMITSEVVLIGNPGVTKARMPPVLLCT